MAMENLDVPATKRDLFEMREGVVTQIRAEMLEMRGGLAAELRAEMADMRRVLSIEIVKTHVRIDRLTETLSAQISEGVSRIVKIADDFTAQVQRVDRDQIITNYRVGELENRVKRLESH